MKRKTDGRSCRKPFPNGKNRSISVSSTRRSASPRSAPRRPSRTRKSPRSRRESFPEPKSTPETSARPVSLGRASRWTVSAQPSQSGVTSLESRQCQHAPALRCIKINATVVYPGLLSKGFALQHRRNTTADFAIASIHEHDRSH